MLFNTRRRVYGAGEDYIWLKQKYPGLTNFYSRYRKGNQTYSGNAMTIVRVNDSSPLALGFTGSQSELVDDSGVAAHCGANVGELDTWNDQIDVCDLTTESGQPDMWNGSDFVTQNGLKSIVCTDGAMQYLDLFNFRIPAGGSRGFIVVGAIDNALEGGTNDYFRFSGTSNRVRESGSSTLNFRFLGSNLNSSGLTQTNLSNPTKPWGFIQNLGSTGSEKQIWAEGSLNASASETSTASAGPSLQLGHTSVPLGGWYFVEFIVFENSTMNQAQIEELMADVGDYYTALEMGT